MPILRFCHAGRVLTSYMIAIMDDEVKARKRLQRRMRDAFRHQCLLGREMIVERPVRKGPQPSWISPTLTPEDPRSLKSRDA